MAKCTVCVADRDRIVAAAGSQSRQYTGKDLDETIKECSKTDVMPFTLMENGKMCRIVENEEPKPNQAVATIVCEGDAI